jgi:hypothetical protein
MGGFEACFLGSGLKKLRLLRHDRPAIHGPFLAMTAIEFLQRFF